VIIFVSNIFFKIINDQLAYQSTLPDSKEAPIRSKGDHPEIPGKIGAWCGKMDFGANNISNISKRSKIKT